MRVWKSIPTHPKGGIYHSTVRSTKLRADSVPRAEAKRYASELERVCREAAPQGSMRPDREYFESRVSALMRAAGVEPPVKQATWKECADMWLKASGAGEATRTKYAGELDQFSEWLGPRARMSIRDLTLSDFSAFHSQLMEEGRTPSTARGTLKRARAVMHRAKVLGYIQENPAELLKLSTDGVDVQRQPFTREEAQMIFGYLRDSRRLDWLLTCQFGLYYGMRLDDARSRQRSEILVMDGIPVIRWLPKKKRRKARLVTVPLVAELKELVSRADGPLTPEVAALRWPSRGFSKILRDAGVHVERSTRRGKAGHSVGNKSFHSFRHTINSWLSDAGVDVRVRQMICDHDDIRTSMRYTHASVQSMADAISGVIQY